MLYKTTKYLVFPKGAQKFYLLLLIGLLLFNCTLLVYQTGGTQFSYVHAFYIPIILASLSFSVLGGVIVGILSSILIGPWMPVNVDHHIYQPIDSIFIRSIFFILVGGISGVGSKIFRNYLLELERHLATNPVTGLPNLKGIQEYIISQEGEKLQTKYAVVVILVSHLKEVSNGLGQDIVEHILKNVSKIMAPAIENYGYFGQIDTENFCIVVYKDTDVPRVVEVCKQVLKNDLIADNIPVFVEYSYGVAFRNDYNDSLKAIIRKAKLAAERSRLHSISYTIFEQKDDIQIQRNIEIIRDLHAAITNKSIYLNFQPTISLKNLEIVGVEALGRWDHPRYGMIPPQEFFSLLEGTVLINNYTKWLIRSALEQLAEWHKENIMISVALNFSMKNFFDAELIDFLFQTTKDLDLPKKYITIEVTETAVAENIKAVADILGMLRQSGFRIAVDDFGTGHSSLQYLFELPLDVIKIDKTFTRACATNSAAEAIIRSAVFLANELKLDTVAEGIETVDDYIRLKALGCMIGQGYYFARPIPAHLVKEWVKTNYIKKNFQLIKS
ncbi:MAG: EAL domain-containing protein [Candidatus Nucleicultricaceae bacterium]